MENVTTPFDRQIAQDLLTIGAVSLAPGAPFTWSSGRRAPIYCDNRLTMGYPEVHRRITDGFARLVSEHALDPEVVAGTATAGIPHAAWLADRLDRPMVYVRSKPKKHGQGQQIEGHLEEGQRVVLVEDLISTGGSALEAARALQDAGAEVAAVLAIFTYGLPAAAHRFAAASFPAYTLTSFDTLLEVAVEEGQLEEKAIRVLKEWQHDPKEWSERVGT